MTGGAPRIWPGQSWTDGEQDFRVTFVTDNYATLHGDDSVRREPILPDGLASRLGALRYRKASA